MKLWNIVTTWLSLSKKSHNCFHNSDEETALRHATWASNLIQQQSNQLHSNLIPSAPTTLFLPHPTPTTNISDPLVGPDQMTVAAPALRDGKNKLLK